MRLPAVNIGQRLREDSRQMNERLYAAYVAGEPLEWPVPDDTTSLDELQRISWNLHKFWSERGFRLKTKIVHRSLVHVWLQSMDIMNSNKTGPSVQVVCVTCGWEGQRRRSWETLSLGQCSCGGELKPRPSRRDVKSDEKAKRDLREQGAA